MLKRIALGLDDRILTKIITNEFKEDEAFIKNYKNFGLLKILKSDLFDIIIVSGSRLQAPINDLLDIISECPEHPDIVIIDNKLSDEAVARFLAAGCASVISPEVPDQLVLDHIWSLIEKRDGVQQEAVAALIVPDEPQLTDIVCNSQAMHDFMRIVAKIARSDSSILILGETGVGKEHLARAIHADGKRSHNPFVPIHCAALPDTLLESELFGHEKGAFTGAMKTRRGAFELAHKGTVFLDEIGDMPLNLQVKLLRVIQEREFRKLGGEKSVSVDVRIIAATNKDLKKEVENGTFRRDLYYRLGVITLTIPPLRERKEDIPALIRIFIEQLGMKISGESIKIEDAAVKALVEYDWPGNIRELINVIERAILLCDNNMVTTTDLPEEIISTALHQPIKELLTEEVDFPLPSELLSKDLNDIKQMVIENVERAYLIACLKEYRGKIKDVAAKSGITTRALYNKMNFYKLKKEEFKIVNHKGQEIDTPN